MGQTIHHKIFNGNNNPIHGLERHVHHILSNGGMANSLLYTVYENNTTTMIDPSGMNKLLWVT
eukprot:643751-Ditylum_brightwellii.AAC.1